MKIEEIKTQGIVQIDTTDAQTWLEAIKGQAVMTGNKFIDGWNQAIRPLITTWNVIVMYTVHKCSVIALVFADKVPLEKAVDILWTGSDYTIMMSIIGFWFVDRSLRKMNGQ